MKEIDIFIQRLNNLASELEMLGREFFDVSKKFDGTDFENQHYLASNKLDNSIHVATHEMATTIGFTGNAIKMLTNFIDFRKECSELTDEELEIIIDHQVIPLKLKLALTKRLTGGNTKLLLDKIETIKQLWNKTFGTNEYRQIMKKISTNL